MQGVRTLGFDCAGGPGMAFLRPMGVNAVGHPVLVASGIDVVAAKIGNGAPHIAECRA